MSEKQTFQTKLEKHDNSEATRIYIPFDVEKVFSAKRVPVSCTINGAEFHSTIMRMNGRFMMAVPKKLREAAKAQGGDTIEVVMQRDLEHRVIEPTEDLAKALGENSDAKIIWDKLSFTHKKEYVLAIENAKRVETRIRRIEKTIEELLKKKSNQAKKITQKL
jgi:bifunctional DNA-binding transcriptional regulator/antitoxin component of YhaV-PrlF toxin-antitoxin module